MRFAARVLNRLVIILLFFAILTPVFSSVALAQTITPNQTLTQTQNNIDPNIILNQHTLIQSVFLEMLLAIQCQLTGIDLVNPTQSCLGINTQDHKLGYAPANSQSNGHLQIGGVMGMLNNSISMMFIPTISSNDYIHYLSDNFGISKALAQAKPYTGFQGLSPILNLWKTSRDIAYFLLIIATIFIGIGVMLRWHIDPKTVMTIQNQIPNVIISIILITFSYALAGLMIDGMWAVTYMGINRITQNVNPNLTGGNQGELSSVATKNLLNDPIGFAGQIFVEKNSPDANGILNLAYGVGQNLGELETGALLQIFFGSSANASCGLSSLGDCPVTFIIEPVRWILGILWLLVVLIAILISLFRIWLELLRAYIMILLYVILGPIWIGFGLLPKRPLGFEQWFRIMFTNMAIFPIVVLMLITGRVLHEVFNSPVAYAPSSPLSLIPVAHAQTFIPPLLSNPNLSSFSMIIEFGVILAIPGVISAWKEKMKATSNKAISSALSSTFAAGRSTAGAPAKAIKERLTKRDQAGNAIGFLAGVSDRATGKIAQISTRVLPGGLGRKVEEGYNKREYAKQNFGSVAGWNKEWKPGMPVGREYSGTGPTTGPHGESLGRTGGATETTPPVAPTGVGQTGGAAPTGPAHVIIEGQPTVRVAGETPVNPVGSTPPTRATIKVDSKGDAEVISPDDSTT